MEYKIKSVYFCSTDGPEHCCENEHNDQSDIKNIDTRSVCLIQLRHSCDIAELIWLE